MIKEWYPCYIATEDVLRFKRISYCNMPERNSAILRVTAMHMATHLNFRRKLGNDN